MYLIGVPVTIRSSMQKMVSLLTTKAELNAVVMGVQGVLLMKNILKKSSYLYWLALIMEGQ